MKSDRPSDYQMPFGKHSGDFLENVPAGYVIWLSKQDNCPEEILDYVEEFGEELGEEVKVEREEYYDKLKRERR